MATQKFWVVMGSGGLSHSPCMHSSKALAFTEAERLSRMNGGTFFVLEAKGSASRQDVRIEVFKDEEEFPF